MPRESSGDVLVLVTMRLRRVDVELAKSIARKTSVPYNHIIRSWVADRAETEQQGSKKRG